VSVTRVLAADDGAARDLWLQIAADALERPVTRIDKHPGSCLGAAFVAGMGVGVLDDWSAIGRYVAPGRTFQPNAEASRVLAAKYRLWRETYERLRTLYPALARIA
jgi:xylulokinase